MKLKGEMEVEVLKDSSAADSLAKARRRQALIMKDADERERCAFDPEGSRAQRHPGYSTEMEEDY